MRINISPIADDYSISPQISVEDLEEIAALGFKTVINYRPDGEGGADQVLSNVLAEKAESLGLTYQHNPVIPGQVTQDNVDDCAAFLNTAPKPILGFCRTGKRATMLYQSVNQD